MRLPASLRAAAAAVVLTPCAVPAQMVPAVRDTTPADSVPEVPVPPAPPGGRSMLRALAGVSLFYVAPRGDFAEHVGGGVGYSLAGSLADDREGLLALRAEWQDLTYGVEFSNDSTSRNVIRSLDLGPQLMLPLGSVRPYASASVGLAYLGTEGSEPCRQRCDDEDDDGGVSIEREGFVMLPRMTYSVGRVIGVMFRTAKATARRPALWMDVRFTMRHNGETRYGVGGTTSRTVRGATDYGTIHVGVSTGMRE